MIAASPWGLSLLLVLQAGCWLAACRTPDPHASGAWQLAGGVVLAGTISMLLHGA